MKQIEVQNLSKSFKIPLRRQGFFHNLTGLVNRKYRLVKALDDISLSISRGELVGYIGPNGAGKSTTIKILAGIMVPDDGFCSINGRCPWKQRTDHVREIGVVFGQRTSLWWDLPVTDSFLLLRDIYRINKHDFAETLEELTCVLDLAALLDVPVRQLSLGQKMRCELAAALLHNPGILFLDEPTIGLDINTKLAVRDFIKKINQQKKLTVILTTHDLDDIEALCTRLIILSEGKIFYDGSLNAFKKRWSEKRLVTVDLEEDVKFSIPQVTLEKKEGHQVTLTFNPQEIPTSRVIREIIDNYKIKDIYIDNPPIEDIIAQTFKRV